MTPAGKGHGRAGPVELRDLPRPWEVKRPALRLPAIRSPLPALRRWLVPVGSLLLTLATGLAASIPVLSSTIDAVRGGWVPTADRAIITTRALDVFTSHTPLVGQYSEAGRVTPHVVHSPGPMLYWLLAPAARWGTATSLPLTMGIVNTLAIVAIVALARRRGGLVLMFATAAGIALMCQSLATEDFHDMWNPAAGLFPFLLLIFLCWSLSCGDYRLLPVIALVASFVTQTHLMYVLPTAALLVIGLGGLTMREIARWRRRRRGEEVPARRRWSLLGWSVAALVVAALCWSAPAIDELQHSPGNLTLVSQTATNRGPTLGAQDGWNAVVRAVGVRPWWLHEPSSRWNRKYDVWTRPGGRATDSTKAILAALLAVAVIGAIRRRRDVTAAAVIALALCAALGAEAAGTPQLPLLAATLGYTMWWGSILGLWVWLVLAWSLWLGVAWTARRAAALARRLLAGRLEGWSWRVPSPALAAAVVCASVLCVGATALVGRTVVATAKTPDEHAPEYAPIAQISKRLDQIVPRGQTINLLQGALDWATMPIKPAVRYFLQQHGDRVLATGSFQRLGYWYELEHRPYSWIVDVADGTRPPHQGLPPAASGRLTLAIRSRFVDLWGPEVLSVWVARVAPAATSRTLCGLRCPRGPSAARGRRR